jgi:hypothetical protein
MCALCSDVLAASSTAPDVKFLRITTRVEGFFLQRFDERGEGLGELQFDTMDEAMWFAYSEYGAISDWRDCPDDANTESPARRRTPPKPESP